ncbi:MAG: metallophosphoesterase, partial [Clostridiales bacterium]|nr:metallophosphoesterase [Clostridiales bacterium]
MDKIYVVLIAVSALILLYILWCFIEPFFLDQDRATLKKTPDDSSPADSITIKKLPMVQSDAKNAPDFRFVFFSDIHAEWCPVSSKRICDHIRKTQNEAPLDAVIFGGDMVSYKQGASKGLRYLNAVRKCCKEIGIPFYGVSGNHD